MAANTLENFIDPLHVRTWSVADVALAHDAGMQSVAENKAARTATGIYNSIDDDGQAYAPSFIRVIRERRTDRRTGPIGFEAKEKVRQDAYFTWLMVCIQGANAALSIVSLGQSIGILQSEVDVYDKTGDMREAAHLDTLTRLPRFEAARAKVLAHMALERHDGLYAFTIQVMQSLQYADQLGAPIPVPREYRRPDTQQVWTHDDMNSAYRYARHRGHTVDREQFEACIYGQIHRRLGGLDPQQMGLLATDVDLEYDVSRITHPGVTTLEITDEIVTRMATMLTAEVKRYHADGDLSGAVYMMRRMHDGWTIFVTPTSGLSGIKFIDTVIGAARERHLDPDEADRIGYADLCTMHPYLMASIPGAQSVDAAKMPPPRHVTTRISTNRFWEWDQVWAERRQLANLPADDMSGVYTRALALRFGPLTKAQRSLASNETTIIECCVTRDYLSSYTILAELLNAVDAYMSSTGDASNVRYMWRIIADAKHDVAIYAQAVSELALLRAVDRDGGEYDAEALQLEIKRQDDTIRVIGALMQGTPVPPPRRIEVSAVHERLVHRVERSLARQQGVRLVSMYYVEVYTHAYEALVRSAGAPVSDTPSTMSDVQFHARTASMAWKERDATWTPEDGTPSYVASAIGAYVRHHGNNDVANGQLFRRTMSSSLMHNLRMWYSEQPRVDGMDAVHSNQVKQLLRCELFTEQPLWCNDRLRAMNRTNEDLGNDATQAQWMSTYKREIRPDEQPANMFDRLCLDVEAFVFYATREVDTSTMGVRDLYDNLRARIEELCAGDDRFIKSGLLMRYALSVAPFEIVQALISDTSGELLQDVHPRWFETVKPFRFEHISRASNDHVVRRRPGVEWMLNHGMAKSPRVLRYVLNQEVAPMHNNDKAATIYGMATWCMYTNNVEPFATLAGALQTDQGRWVATVAILVAAIRIAHPRFTVLPPDVVELPPCTAYLLQLVHGSSARDGRYMRVSIDSAWMAWSQWGLRRRDGDDYVDMFMDGFTVEWQGAMRACGEPKPVPFREGRDVDDAGDTIGIEDMVEGIPTLVSGEVGDMTALVHGHTETREFSPDEDNGDEDDEEDDEEDDDNPVSYLRLAGPGVTSARARAAERAADATGARARADGTAATNIRRLADAIREEGRVASLAQKAEHERGLELRISMEVARQQMQGRPLVRETQPYSDVSNEDALVQIYADIEADMDAVLRDPEFVAELIGDMDMARTREKDASDALEYWSRVHQRAAGAHRDTTRVTDYDDDEDDEDDEDDDDDEDEDDTQMMDDDIRESSSSRGTKRSIAAEDREPKRRK